MALAGCAQSNGSNDPLTALSIDGHGYSLTTYRHIVNLYRAYDAANGQGGATDWQTPAGRTNRATAEAETTGFLTRLETDREQVRAQHVTVPQSLINQLAKQEKDTYEANLKQDPNNTNQQAFVHALTGDVLALFAEQAADEQVLVKSPKIIVHSNHLRVLVTSKQADAQLYERQAQQGSDFAALVKQHSVDTQTAVNGGEVGVVYQGQLDSEFDTPLFAGKLDAKHPVQYVIVPFTPPGSGTQYYLFEVTQPANTHLSAITDPQTQQLALSGWLTVLQKQAKVQTYVTGL
jgi:hypothetical protein